ncbi:phosphopentomutase, partial [Paenibacillus sp. TAF58]
PGTDHTREYVPILLYSPSFQSPASLGIRGTFADLGATIADNFGVSAPEQGESFLHLLK